LLDAAGEIFARDGFDRATVRDICQAAGANIAAVNYHFRNKEGLYTAVLQHGLARSLMMHPPDQGVSPAASPERRLEVFVHSFLQRLLISDAQGHYSRLMVREMSEPTAAMDTVVKEHIRPLSSRLVGIVREVLGSEASQEMVMQHAMSIVGQCVFYRHAERVIGKLWPKQKHTPAAIARLAMHITQFSLAGMLAGQDRLSAKRKAAK
jgi:TetR/AcrR family transcriptional regulator, regulator of cefoperazone and chloramphenicol sensitivity